ncbi:ACSL4 [Symbiodinium sp. CCMP2592]|nr:ACSL4 [Symbiodinium sp. CCMP2592]
MLAPPSIQLFSSSAGRVFRLVESVLGGEKIKLPAPDEQCAGGQVKIIDRNKTPVKLKGGEYVALEIINVTYKNQPRGRRTQAMKSIGRYCSLSANGKSCLSLQPKVESLEKMAEAVKLPSLMQATAVMPVLEPWTPDNGCLTATSKLVPKTIYKVHEKDLGILKLMAVKTEKKRFSASRRLS